MHVTSLLHSGLGPSVAFLNQPVVKESVKKIAGVATFIFGLIEIYHLYEVAKEGDIAVEMDFQTPPWIRTANKVTILFARISLILSVATSRPGALLISTLMGRLTTQAQLNSMFGPNAIFAINPWHPRHVASIAAAIFAVPMMIQSIYMGLSWICLKAPSSEEELLPINQNSEELIDTKERLMVLFSMLTSRPILHWGNQFITQFTQYVIHTSVIPDRLC